MQWRLDPSKFDTCDVCGTNKDVWDIELVRGQTQLLRVVLCAKHREEMVRGLHQPALGRDGQVRGPIG